MNLACSPSHWLPPKLLWNRPNCVNQKFWTRGYPCSPNLNQSLLGSQLMLLTIVQNPKKAWVSFHVPKAVNVRWCGKELFLSLTLPTQKVLFVFRKVNWASLCFECGRKGKALKIWCHPHKRFPYISKQPEKHLTFERFCKRVTLSPPFLISPHILNAGVQWILCHVHYFRYIEKLSANLFRFMGCTRWINALGKRLKDDRFVVKVLEVIVLKSR